MREPPPPDGVSEDDGLDVVTHMTCFMWDMICG